MHYEDVTEWKGQPAALVLAPSDDAHAANDRIYVQKNRQNTAGEQNPKKNISKSLIRIVTEALNLNTVIHVVRVYRSIVTLVTDTPELN